MEIAPKREYKVFNDTIHGHMKIPKLCCSIINTPEFSRLRNLKQMGFVYHLYPAASHNRFEHSIRTCYLAGEYLKILKKQEEVKKINTPKDILCVQIAALCHDLGHGPYSHAWENFVNEYREKQNISSKYDHEIVSVKMFESIVIRIRDEFVKAKFNESDFIFIKEMIYGKPLPGNNSFNGRGLKKYFLYQIVSNPTTKIDVDKFDYMLRDSRQLNLSMYFDYKRLMFNSRVLVDEEGGKGEDFKQEISYQKKIKESIDDLFRDRKRLHKAGCQHHIVRKLDKMFVEGLILATPHFLIKGSDHDRQYGLHNAHEDPVAFLKLTDSVFDDIKNGKGGNEAARIFKNIENRLTERFMGFIFMDKPIEELFSSDMFSNLKSFLAEKNISFTKAVLKTSEDSDKLNKYCNFYDKGAPNKKIKIDPFPVGDIETRYYFCCKRDLTDEEYKRKRESLNEWTRENLRRNLGFV